MKYAQRTTIPVSRSRSDIEQITLRYGADQFASAIDWESERAMVQFRIHTWMVRFLLPFAGSSEQQQRQRWRALLLVIKAKLEAVECGITTVEQEFLAHIVTPQGDTFGDWALPKLRHMKERGELPTSFLPPLIDRE